ncbi:hypothetical protein [uncultured Nostoc sp.]|uniref:hypothetical protein n=1 Tax=uncultured Nostoc sp. TaxID=340711 RepID=UPI0035CC3AFB
MASKSHDTTSHWHKAATLTIHRSPPSPTTTITDHHLHRPPPSPTITIHRPPPIS